MQSECQQVRRRPLRPHAVVRSCCRKLADLSDNNSAQPHGPQGARAGPGWWEDGGMRPEELRVLLSREGLQLLDELPPYESAADVVAIVSRLRAAGHAPELVAAVLTQAKLRGRARAKFGAFAGRMLFTEAGLEQATRLSVAAQHAGRFARAGVARVADLGCGIGGDAMAFA